KAAALATLIVATTGTVAHAESDPRAPAVAAAIKARDAKALAKLVDPAGFDVQDLELPAASCKAFSHRTVLVTDSLLPDLLACLASTNARVEDGALVIDPGTRIALAPTGAPIKHLSGTLSSGAVEISAKTMVAHGASLISLPAGW